MQQTLPTFFHKSMIKTYLKEQILFNFGFKPTSDQMKAVEAFADFVLSDDNDKAFILRGYAGTGKTFIASVGTGHVHEQIHIAFRRKPLRKIRIDFLRYDSVAAVGSLTPAMIGTVNVTDVAGRQTAVCS